MTVADDELAAVGDAARAVIAEAKAAGVYVFAGGIDEAIAPVLIRTDGTVCSDLYPGSRLDGGFAIFELPRQVDAIEWARRIAAACRCAQEVRVFMYDPAS
ncbi:transcription initiation protein [Sphingomonas sp.]|uniref:transcription initiation protein n=1 Tax=Sphingomonas sp. TaxID=28214 RepID=UPI003BAB3B4F